MLFFIIYYLISTFIFLNLIFNKRIDFEMVNKKTGEVRQPNLMFIITFSLFWIVFFPKAVIKGMEGSTKNDE